MAGYTRQSTFTDGDIINAADSNDEFNQLVNTFSNTTGHKHDGTAAEGPVIGLIGDPGVTTPINKVVVDDTNNRVGVFIDAAGAGTSVEQMRIQDGAIVPVTDNDIDLGASGAEFKDLYIDGVAYVDSIAMPTTTVTDILDEDTMTSDSATALATQQSIKAYVDAQVTAQDLDFQADSGGALNIDLDTETLTLTGGTGIDTSGAGNTVTFAIDSTVATLTGTQTLTNKTIDAASNTVSNIDTTHLGAGILDTDLTTVAATDTTLPSAKAVKTYVDSQVTAQDLDFQADTGGALSIDLDSETMTFTGGTGIDTSGSGNTVTFAIDSTVATLTGTQTLTNKTLTSPVISSISNTGTVTLPTSTDTLVGRATTDTLTNKTLTSAVLNGTISGTSIKDEDNMVSDSASHLATQQSIKAYVDAQVGGAGTLNDVVDDTTPQLGGNLDVQSNSITTSTVNGGITLTPNGTGNVTLGTMVLDADQSIGAGQDNYVLTYDNAAGTISLEAAAAGISDVVDDTTPQLGGNLDVNGQSIVSASGGNIAITPDTTGSVIIDGLSHPQADGSANQSLVTNGSGTLSFASRLADVVDDTTPQLGGNLDVQSSSITTSTVNGSITLTPNGTGDVVLGNFTLDADQTVGAGQDNYVLTYDHTGGKISLEAVSAVGDGDGLAFAIALG